MVTNNEPTKTTRSGEPAKAIKPAEAASAIRTSQPVKVEGSSAPIATARASKAKRSKPARRRTKGTGAGKRGFPSVTLEEAVKLPLQIKEKNEGNPWSPQDLAAALGTSHKTTPFFYLTAGSRDYGFTEGTRYMPRISLGEVGKRFVFAKDKDAERQALQDAFFNVPLFKSVYDYYKGATLPELKYLGNTLQTEFKLATEHHEDFHRIFQANCQFVQKFGDISAPVSLTTGKPSDGTITLATPTKATGLRAFVLLPFSEKSGAWAKGFFSEVLNSLITPAGVSAGFKVETARREGSDIIQATIVNELLNADLVIADLTEHNPNVLFELGLRMAFEKPVALIRAEGTLPIFDVDNMLRVWSYNPSLWHSTLETDIPALSAHVKGTWENRKSAKTYMQLLKEH
jgi:hypothetical protein